MVQPTLLGDLEALGLNPLHLAVVGGVVLATLALAAAFARPRGTARLTYFEGHGRAEEVRLMLALCGVPWQDAVYADEDGAPFITTEAQMRAIMRAGVLAMDQLPLLELDGLYLVQQNAILRYLARRHHVYGSGLDEAAQIDILSDSLTDWAPITALMQGKEDAAGRGHGRYLDCFARALRSNSRGEFLVGKTVSFVDVQLFQALEQLVASGTAAKLKLADKWPELEAYRARVRELAPIAAYLASGRQTSFPRKGGANAFFAQVRAVMPWVFGQADQPPLLCSEWRFRK
jgi:glutathione S-transferase